MPYPIKIWSPGHFTLAIRCSTNVQGWTPCTQRWEMISLNKSGQWRAENVHHSTVTGKLTLASSFHWAMVEHSRLLNRGPWPCTHCSSHPQMMQSFVQFRTDNNYWPLHLLVQIALLNKFTSHNYAFSNYLFFFFYKQLNQAKNFIHYIMIKWNTLSLRSLQKNSIFLPAETLVLMLWRQVTHEHATVSNLEWKWEVQARLVNCMQVATIVNRTKASLELKVCERNAVTTQNIF